MGVRAQNIKGLLKDARSRTILIITFSTLLIAIIVGYLVFHRAVKGPAASADISGSPGLTAIPTGAQASPEYAALVQEANLNRAKEAAQSGGSAIPTIIKSDAPGTAQAGEGVGGLGFQQLAQSQGGTEKLFVIDALKQRNCEASDLQQALKNNVSVNDLREAGCSAMQLEQAGLTPQQLQSGGFSACDLLGTSGVDPSAMKKAGYSAGELRGVGYNACQLRNAGFTPAQLLTAGFTPEELKGVGFTPAQIAAAEAEVPTAVTAAVNVPGLPLGITAAALKSAGCGIAAMQQAISEGVSAAVMRNIGCSATQLKQGGYSAQQLKDAGFTAGELKEAGFSAADLKNIGFSAAALRAAGYTALELKAAGFSAADLKNAGFPFDDLKAAGFPEQDLKSAGFTALPSELKNEALKVGGCSAPAVQKAISEGVTATEMKQVGCNAEHLKLGGYTVPQLQAAGFSTGELRAAGFSASELKDAGFTAGELRAAGYTPPQLKNSGFSAGELKDAGFTAGELAAAGFAPTDLKNAGFNAAQLKAAGFSATDLRMAGYNASQLSNAGFTSAELKNAGFSAAEMQNAGYSAQQLTAAGFTPDELTAAGIAGPSSLQQTPTIAKPPQSELASSVTSVSTPSNLMSAEDQQRVAAQQQELVQKQQVVAAAISSQMSQLFAAWAPPTQSLVQGIPPQVGPTGAAGAGPGGGPGGATALSPPIIKAGTIMFAVLTSGVNSDYPGPILATIVSGRYKGSRLIGSLTTFPPYGKKVMLSFNTMNTALYGATVSINAVAISPTTAETALSSDTNNHYLIRFGSLFASAFLEGYGQAFLQSGQQIISTAASTTVTSPTLSPAGKLYVALGNVGNQFGSLLQPLFNMPPTVKVYSGTGVGILFLQDVASPVTS